MAVKIKQNGCEFVCFVAAQQTPAICLSKTGLENEQMLCFFESQSRKRKHSYGEMMLQEEIISSQATLLGLRALTQ